MTTTSGVHPTTRSQSRSQDKLTIWGPISGNLKLPHQNRQNQLGHQNQNRNENQNQIARGPTSAEISDKELPERMLTRANLLLIDPRSTIFAIRDIEVYGAPGRCWQEINFGHQVW